ncbi:MAG: GLPGLI family protein [Bacteroidetes bacterium]|nr:GLPGLI family protein [Bacteroidota bacterium]
MIKALLIILYVGIPSMVLAQYTAQGKIEFERKVNIHRQLDDMAAESGGSWFEKMKSQIPKFVNSYFDLSFNRNGSLYKPGREVENPNKMMFGNTPAADNIVFTNFQKNSVVATKNVFEEKFLVQDSIRKIDWKILDEVRTIANFKCRKAVGKIFDSVYVVAFYTDEIMVSGGPEMFAGLPGMILEIAIPRLYSTWVATKVETNSPKPEDFKIPEKGKKVSQFEMYENIQSSIKKWGSWAQRSIWWSML